MSTHCVSTYYHMNSISLSLNCVGCQTIKWLRRPDSSNASSTMIVAVLWITPRWLRDNLIRRSLKREDLGAKHPCELSSKREYLKIKHLYEANLGSFIHLNVHIKKICDKLEEIDFIYKWSGRYKMVHKIKFIHQPKDNG